MFWIVWEILSLQTHFLQEGVPIYCFQNDSSLVMVALAFTPEAEAGGSP